MMEFIPAAGPYIVLPSVLPDHDGNEVEVYLVA
jgi:hypothetical protein